MPFVAIFVFRFTARPLKFIYRLSILALKI